MLDDYFVKKYSMGSYEETKQGILQLFQYESEIPMFIDEKTVDELIDKYEEKKPI